MATIGYARVSTRDQSLDIQIDQIKAAGCSKIFHEKQSGAKSDWPALRRMLKSLEPGDVVVVARLDRLARSTRDLPWFTILRQRGPNSGRSLTLGAIRPHRMASCC